MTDFLNNAISGLSDLTRTDELPLFMRLMDMMHDGVMVVDLNEVVVYVNNRLCEITGYTHNELVGNVAADVLLKEEAAPTMRKKVKERSQRISENYEIKVRRKDGREIWLRISGSPILDVDNKVVGSIGLHTDITEKKEYEQRLKSTLSEKALLLKETHHRVKNNLQVISSLMSLQIKTINTREDAIEAFVTCQKRIYAMSVIHDIVYDFGDSGMINFTMYGAKLISHLCRALGTKEQNILVDTNLAVNRMNVDDALTCGLLINELLTNSVEHAFDGNGGSVVLSITHEKKKIKFSFSDDGKGLPDNFDPNFGDSLGLSLIQSFADRLDGQLDISGRDGASFQIVFPKKEEQQTA